MNIGELQKTCAMVRRDLVQMVTLAGSGHPGGSLSCVEMLVALYFSVLRIDPENPRLIGRDRFVLSKGHAAPAYYAVLGERGFFPKAEFRTLRQLHSILQGHPDAKRTPGVDASTGSLGHGVSIATGMAMAAKAQKSGVRVYTLLGDGELQEGMVWEALMAAAHYHLDNLTVLIDNNGLQIDGSNEEVMSLGSLKAKMEAFGFFVLEVSDGNDIRKVLDALNVPAPQGIPKCILAHTVKGKGVSFMENQAGWHGRAPSQAECDTAMAELEGM